MDLGSTIYEYYAFQVENLRVLVWKASVNPNFQSDQQLGAELQQLKERVSSILIKLFFPY